LDAAGIREPSEGISDAEQLGRLLLLLSTSDGLLADLHVLPPRCTETIGERPVASPYARWQASTGHSVTNLRHERVGLSHFERYLLVRLDGQHDRQRLRESLTGLVQQGMLTVSHSGQPIEDRQRLGEVLDGAIGQQQVVFARNALLHQVQPG
jgi:hypothetical protein